MAGSWSKTQMALAFILQKLNKNYKKIATLCDMRNLCKMLFGSLREINTGVNGTLKH
jgi:hypothetical protein